VRQIEKEKEGDWMTHCETCNDNGFVIRENGAGIHNTCNATHVICPDCGNPNDYPIPEDDERYV
jgi:hypothetical protein